MKECIFCKIISGDIPSVKIWEDDDFVAILDINPSREGVTLIISKEHHDSDFSLLPEELVCKFVVACQKVSKMIKSGLGTSRVIMVAEGLGVNHAHFKLYPYFEGGEGHLTTAIGKQATVDELKQVAAKIVGKKP